MFKLVLHHLTSKLAVQIAPFVFILIGCGEPTYGPLERGGRADRHDLVQRMAAQLGYLPAGLQALDALIVVEYNPYILPDSTFLESFKVTARMVDEEGYIIEPVVFADTLRFLPWLDRQTMRYLVPSRQSYDTLRLLWPRDTVSLPLTFPTREVIGDSVNIRLYEYEPDTTPIALPGQPGERLIVNHTLRYQDDSHTFLQESIADSGFIRVPRLRNELGSDFSHGYISAYRTRHSLFTDPRSGMVIGVVVVIRYTIDIETP